MSGYLTIFGLMLLQTLVKSGAQEDGVWLAEVAGKPIALTRIERNDQEESTGDFFVKEGSAFPKMTRRGYAGEEFFLKASKSVPRIGRRNDDFKSAPKRSWAKSMPRIGQRNGDFKTIPKRSASGGGTDPAAPEEYWQWLQSNGHVELNSKPDFDFPYGCQQLDAKTIFLVDMYNFVCNDQFYCCATAKRVASK
ncbi:uncharacterized protein LOC126841272 [Adelges cooleyi]|uniref:uncharacterized protein LOC126841272 n=1 Tax=Adelges cooleyi TaxID=133065 RepID=UPI002180643F|nr:uncharacterized protein LOC126841272 [Adelges cooleyi]